MTMQQKIEQFKAALKKMKAYQHAMGVMFYDFETVMPKGAAEDSVRRGLQDADCAGIQGVDR